MLVVFLLSTAFLSAALGIVLGRYVFGVSKGDPRVVDEARAEAARLEQECATLRNRALELDKEHKAAVAEARSAAEEVARVTERVSGLTKRGVEQLEQISSLESEITQFKAEAVAASAEVARLTERVERITKQAEEQAKQSFALDAQLRKATNDAQAATVEVAQLKERDDALMQKVERQEAQLAEQQKQLTVEFENIANRILKANSMELSENSQKALGSVLDPLRERILEFQKRIETSYAAENREVLSLKEQIKMVIETSHAIGNQADGLAKALRGDSQLLGRWGELALERILEAAGLTEGREYISQGRGLGLKSDSGALQKPDIIVMLPEHRTMIIDSKTPLASYERLIAAKDKAEITAYGDQLVRDMKAHIDGLSGKRYQENDKLQAHDCVLMFVPIEGALAVALTREPDLFVYAWDKRVVLVGPPTLLMTMRTVASIWRYEMQGRNAQEIARLAGDLCDKVTASLVDLNVVAEKITGALAAHNDAVKRLATGKGNVLSIGHRIRNLGVKAKKPMPSMLVDGISIPSSTLLMDEDDELVSNQIRD